MVRFAHDPRTRQIAMLDEGRFEVLDIAVRPGSRLVGRPLAELPPTTSVIGAIVRDGALVFPRDEQQLQAGDRVIVLPFLLGGVEQLSNPVDAYSESMSGFTATGATVLTHIEALGQAMQFWRQLTHWLGGMGVIILAIAVLPRLRVGGRGLLRRELPGPRRD